MLFAIAAVGLAGLYALGHKHEGQCLVQDEEVDRLSYDDLVCNYQVLTGKPPFKGSDDAFLRRVIKYQIKQQGVTSLL